MNTILVLGASGFLGSHICQCFSASGWHVIGLVRESSDTTYIERYCTTIHRINDLRNARELILSTSGLDAIVQCANAYGRGDEPSVDLVTTNVMLPLACYEAAGMSGVRTFIHLDTCFTLDYPYLRPYTLSKKQMSAWGQELSQHCTCRFINLELQHPFGERDRPGKFVPWVIQQCLTGELLELSPGDQKRDFVYAGDVGSAVKTIVTEMRNAGPGFSSMECGRGESISIHKFVKLIHGLTRSNSELVFGALPHRANEIMFTQADNSKLNRLGWMPDTSLESGLARTIKFISTHQQATD